MKDNRTLRNSSLSVLAALAALCAGPSLLGQTDLTVSAFDSDDEIAAWPHWWGASAWTTEFDAAMDAGNKPGSGSMKVTVQFDGPANGGDNQFAFRRDLAAVTDGTKYKSLAMDVRFDPASAQRPAKDLGYFEYGVRLPDWSQNFFGHVNVPITNGWIHLETPIPITAPGIDTIAGVTFKMWMGADVSGTTTFWVDNVKLVAPTNNVPPPPPTLSLGRPVPGLELIASKGGAQYQRQSIRTANNAYSWIGSSQPVTYSLTITNWPPRTNGGFQAHVFLVPGASLPTWETSPDWNEPNVVFFQIANGASNYVGRFMYKTNLPNGNAMLWTANGTLATLQSPQVLGTWSLSFSQDGNITMQAPGNLSTNFTLPAESAALFADPLYAYFGVQPNEIANIGLSATLTRIQISGAATPIDEKFTGATLDPSVWQVVAEDPNGVVLVPSDTSFLLSWSLPATGFGLQLSRTLSSGSWADPGLTNILTVSGRRLVLLPGSFKATNSFYRLLKP